MKKNGMNAKPTSLAAILLLAIPVTLVIVGLSRIRPDGISNFFIQLLRGEQISREDPNDAEYAELFADLARPETEPPRLLDSISLTEAFAQFPFAESYRHVYTVTYADGTRENTKCISLSRTGESYQVLIFDSALIDPQKLYLSATFDGQIYTVRDKQGNQRLYTPGEDFPLSSIAMLPDTDTFCAMLREHEQNPDASPLADCSAAVEESEQGRMLVLRFTDKETGSSEEYRYLLDYGILYSAVGMMDGVAWYTLETINFSDTPG